MPDFVVFMQPSALSVINKCGSISMRTVGGGLCVRYLRSEYQHKHKNIIVLVRDYWNKTKKDNDDTEGIWDHVS